MAMPSGLRNSEPKPLPSASGSPPEQRGHGGHHNGAEAQQTGFVDCIRRILPVFPLGLQREVDHHDAVFFHDADQENDADDSDYAQILTKKK